MPTTFCTRLGRDMGRHFVADGDEIRSARYCYYVQSCTRPTAPFGGVIQDMANGEWKHPGYAGLTLEEQLVKMYGHTSKIYHIGQNT